MQLKKLQLAIDAYKRHLASDKAFVNAYKWESLRNFQENWNVEADDWLDMYNRALENTTSRRLWKREKYEPKRLMLLLANHNILWAKHVFTDLLNEQKDVEGRADRFIYQCDEMLREYKSAYPLSIENNHYHNDRRHMVSLYLSFRYPDKYALYDATAFSMAMVLLGSPDTPGVDLGRYIKVSRTLYTFLMKDPQVWELHTQRLHPQLHYQDKTLLLVNDFCDWLSAQKSL